MPIDMNGVCSAMGWCTMLNYSLRCGRRLLTPTNGKRLYKMDGQVDFSMSDHVYSLLQKLELDCFAIYETKLLMLCSRQGILMAVMSERHYHEFNIMPVGLMLNGPS